MNPKFFANLRRAAGNHVDPWAAFEAKATLTLNADLGRGRDQWLWGAAFHLIQDLGMTNTARHKRPMGTDDIVIEFEQQTDAMLYWLSMPIEWH